MKLLSLALGRVPVLENAATEMVRMFVLVLFWVLFPGLRKPEPPTGVLNGGLTTIADGTPVEGATVTLYKDDKITEVDMVKSDEKGAYLFAPRGRGSYFVTGTKNTVDANDVPDGNWLYGEALVVIDADVVTVDLPMEKTIIEVIRTKGSPSFRLARFQSQPMYRSKRWETCR